MKILIVSQYFYPEDFKVNDIAFDFAKDGNDITVLTGKPNYPKGNFYKGYGFFKKRSEIINGVKVIRIPLFPRLNGSGKYLILNYFSFIFFSIFAILFRIKGRYDVVFSHHPSPLTSAIPAIWCSKKLKIPLVIWVLDLWPESVSANTNIKKGFLYNSLKKVINYIYSNSSKILVSSKTFKDSIIKEFNVEDGKIEYFPNWAEDIFTKKKEIKYQLPDLPQGFNIMFAGNIGDSQDFESVLNAAQLTKKQNINWILIGDGRKFDWIKNQIETSNITNVYLLGRYPLNTMPKFFQKADAMLVSLKDEPTFALTIPAKIQAYMASKKIILGMLNGEGKELINHSKSGFAVNAGDYNLLAKKAIELSSLRIEERKKMELNALNHYNTYFSKPMLFCKLQSIFSRTTNE